MNFDKKITELIQRMTLEEKASQMLHTSPAIERLDIPAYNWWNEALHGIARAGIATVFPQAIALAATFDKSLLFRVADAISTEARIKYYQAVDKSIHAQYQGLTFWTPNINIFRDPRWGRGQETYGEDPVLTAEMGVSFVRGLQGDHPEYLKTAACAKHFAVHSGPEKDRHIFDAVVNKKDLWETYLPAFKALVDENVESVMGAYNRTLGEPCCASEYLMNDILRGKWNFQGHYVSDCWAIRDFHEHHKVTKTPEESTALAVNTGCDLNCGCTYEFIIKAVKSGLIDEKKLDESLLRLFRTRFKLAMFEEPEQDPFRSIDPKLMRSEDHLNLAKEAAVKSVVLLKNDNILPLDSSPKRILVIGPAAANAHTLMANYHGLSPRFVTILEGLTGKLIDNPLVSMDYHQGCQMYSENQNTGWTVGMAEAADVVIACFGLDNAIEGEEGDAIASISKGDRTDVQLPKWQLDYLRALKERGTPIILVLTGGAAISVPDDIADAVLFAWYPGERGGEALADLIFGDTVPSGKLPVTFPKSVDQLPPYEDYSMKGRTYRYMEEEPQYPFGFGLSYTQFQFSSISADQSLLTNGGTVNVKVEVANTGKYDAEEVVQIYIRKKERTENDPRFSLKAFQRVLITAGEKVELSFSLSADHFMQVNEEGESVLLPGDYVITAADCAPYSSAIAKGVPEPKEFEITIL